MAENDPKSTATETGAPTDQKAKGSPAAVMIALAVVLCLGAVYIFTGLDPFNLFLPTETPQIIVEEASTTQAASTQTSPATPRPTRTPAPQATWWQVYFTDPATINDPDNIAGSLEERLIQYIDAAQETIHIAAFEFNLTPVAEALIAAKKRGVEVRWITDDEYGLEADEDEDHGQFAMLKKAKIEIKDDGRSALMHNKFWIFDSRIVWTGSTNATVNDIFRNNNNVIIFDAPEIAAIYERQFAEMWAGNFGPKSPSTITEQSITLDRIPIQFLFSPEDHVIDQLIPLVQKAKKSIYFMAFSFTHDPLAQAMLERSQAGVLVQGIFETRASETEYSELPMMFCAGLPVRQDINPRTFHHKVIIIDKKIVITGSLNFSANADDSNNENTIIITDTKIARLYLDEFERRWAEAREPDRASMKCK